MLIMQPKILIVSFVLAATQSWTCQALVSSSLMRPSAAFSSRRQTTPQLRVSKSSSSVEPVNVTAPCRQGFNLTTALQAGGLAFDAYVEPAANSSRWERGPQGLQVAFCSQAYTRQLYKGLIEVTVQRITGLPENEAGAAERFLKGKGVDACLLVAVLEGQWKEDVEILQKQQYHTGVLDLLGAAHVSRSSTCWSSVDKNKAKANKAKHGKALPYHIPATWGKGGEAVWPEDERPFYLYVHDPAAARLVFTVFDEGRGIVAGSAVGSTYKQLKSLIPQAALNQTQLIDEMKRKVLGQLKGGATYDQLDDATKTQIGATVWQGTMRLTSKPPKKDKKGQMMAAAAAGAALAGPLGAAVGAVGASFYEGEVQGSITCRIRYLPIPQVPVKRKTYTVYGGMPGIDWGTMYYKYLNRELQKTGHWTKEEQQHRDPNDAPQGGTNDLEHCFFVNHKQTGATCAVYRSLEMKLVVVSFRGTCAPVDLITDASLIQAAWVDGENIENQSLPKVHFGFRSSMNSISRRLKELILATPGPGEDIADYDMLVTGHSLGGALATLFTADIGQYGVDAGRGLPQLEPSEPWWKAVTSAFGGKSETGEHPQQGTKRDPPRPKSLRLYNFGSPRVGNEAFAELFDALTGEGFIDQAYRIVNGEDVVARLPRTVNALVLGKINYEHVGTTVLLSQPESNDDDDDDSDEIKEPKPLIWIEGESDDSKCPVRDGVSLSSPTAEGTLLGDLLSATQEYFASEEDGKSEDEKNVPWTDLLGSVAGKVTERIKHVKASDLASVLGIDRDFTERELRIIQSLAQGKALAHHLEDEYYAGMGRACGFLAQVGEELVELEESTLS